MLFSRNPRTEDFEAAALPHMNDIYRTASRLLGGTSGADDVVQDVYLQAWKSFGQFELGTNCRAWLYKILCHTMHHYRRKWLNIRMVRESDEILDHTPANSPPLPEHITDEEVVAALNKVPQDYRAAKDWFLAAAEQGHIAAQGKVAAAFWSGKGAPQDYSKAYYWALLAQAGGDKTAPAIVMNSAARLSPAQIQAEQKQADQWLHSRHIGKAE